MAPKHIGFSGAPGGRGTVSNTVSSLEEARRGGKWMVMVIVPGGYEPLAYLSFSP